MVSCLAKGFAVVYLCSSMFQGDEASAVTSTNWRGYRIAAWIGQFFLAIATIVVLVHVGWQAAIILLIFLIASFIFVLKDRYLPTFVDLIMDTIGAIAASLLSLLALQEQINPRASNTDV